MAILILDHTQRLQLHAIIGSQRASVDDMRLFWRIQDRIDLTADEKTAVNYQVHSQGGNGQTYVTWNRDIGMAPREYEFTQDEFQKVQKIIKEWQPGFLIAADRVWLESLLGQLENGNSGPTQQSPIPGRYQ